MEVKWAKMYESNEDGDTMWQQLGSSLPLSLCFNALADWMDHVCGGDDVMVTHAVVCDSVCVVLHTPLSFDEVYSHVTQSDKQ